MLTSASESAGATWVSCNLCSCSFSALSLVFSSSSSFRRSSTKSSFSRKTADRGISFSKSDIHPIYISFHAERFYSPRVSRVDLCFENAVHGHRIGKGWGRVNAAFPCRANKSERGGIVGLPAEQSSCGNRENEIRLLCGRAPWTSEWLSSRTERRAACKIQTAWRPWRSLREKGFDSGSASRPLGESGRPTHDHQPSTTNNQLIWLRSAVCGP